MKKNWTGRKVGVCFFALLLLVGLFAADKGGGPVTAVAAGVAGDGASLLDGRCSVCHSADRPRRARKSPSEWEATVSRMVGKGAQLSATEKGILIDYLAKTYGR